ncbi:hypothetical protein TNCV_2104641 [Trichonephila clavipes]|nr:hypothetical protein TNCV_2104641 [Trichonephila clavipes]
MPRRRIRAHYEQLSEFQRGRIIGLKEEVFSDESRFHLCPDDHRKRVWRRPGQYAHPASLLHSPQALNNELWSGMQLLLKPDPIGHH